MHPQIGDIVFSSWGYDQTNVDFYEVVGKQGKITYFLQQIGTAGVKGSEDKVVPDIEVKEGEPFKKRVKVYGDDDYFRYSFNLTSYSSAYPYDGKPKYQTPFGCGH